MTNRPFVLVAGMHRSGTSAVARVIQGLGFDLGPDEHVMGADASNVHGHFEFVPVVDLNDELLDLVDSHWACPVHDAGVVAGLASGAFGDRARGLLQTHRFGPGSMLKDPRFSLTVEFWRTVVDEPLRIVVPFRDPREVARSLARRDGFTLEYALDLWAEYHARLLRAVEGLSVVPVDFADLLANPGVAVERLGHALGADAAPSVAALIDATAPSATVADVELNGWHQSVWQAVRALPTGVAGPQPGLDGSPSFEPLASLLHVMRAERLRAHRDRDEARGAQLEAQQAAAEREADRAIAVAQVVEAEQARDTARHHFTVASRARERLQTELDQARDELARSEQRRRDEVDEMRDELEQLMRADVDSFRGRLEGERDYFAGELDAVYGSRAGQLVRAVWAVRRRLGPGDDGATDVLDGGPRELTRSGAGPEPVVIPTHDEPKVTVVVPVYGQLDMTARCLASLARHESVHGFETVVVDDASPDDGETAAWLASGSGYTVLTNPTNLGFLLSTNRGAERADGRHVLLLNNDAEVVDGCIDALVDRLESTDAIGAVGAKLIYPDGALQEAGSIVWSDASGWNYGKGLDAHDWRFNFARDVDYCSAACLLVRGSVWADLDGFDLRYTPAYYEDTDLCFRIREAGGRVVYEPAAVAVHHEGASHGRDENVGLKAHQANNLVTFRERWADTLASAHHAPDTDPQLAAWRGGRRVLVFDHEVPASDHDSGSVRMETLLRILRDSGRKVTFFPHNRHDREPYASRLRAEGIEVGHGWDDWRALIEQLGPELDAVIVSRPSVAAELIPIAVEAAPTVPIVYDMVDFHGLRLQRRSETSDVADTASLRHARVMTEFERALVRMADHTIAITEVEADAIRALESDADVAVVPNVHTTPRSTAAFDDRNGVMFIGSYRHPPNRDAIRLLMDNVMPIVWARNPEITLHLVGSDLPHEIADPSLTQVVVHGWVEDLDPLFERVRLNVAPLRFGAGMKGKVGDSLSRGVPVVTTSIGAEGFGPKVTEALTIAESASELANAIVALHADGDRWQRLADAGADAVECELGLDAVASALLGIAPLRGD